MKTCIIITATIDPKGMVFTKRNSPEDRLNDYKKVFKEFCKQQEVSNIIFIENSGYSLDYFENEKKKYPDKKIEIMELYENEVGKHPFPRSEKNIRALATFRGATGGFNAAESFMTLKEVI